ncbi:exported hypothetical protein [Mesorhizobium prunaredense]|uniref:Uncharacterized protein n=1 Tax=Mesorhizobium prunaredense TaxID=1631249 RepID=A0A1R3VB66_9HYPH|nr:hypothetical protein [Mesorhizobium prunaredense]SIT57109.1 exported hypothetical protein [Mesorhizobium prunaredense]
MPRLFIALCALILFPPMATASALYDELAAAKIKLLGTPRAGPGMGLWAQQTNERLLSAIEGKWFDLGYSDLTSEEGMKKYCLEYGVSFKKLTDYSFEMISQIRPPRAKQPIHKEYIFRTGMTYNFRWNVQQQMDVQGTLGGNGKQILRYANGTSALMMTTPNTLFEVDFDLGIPFLWGRCPAE